MLDFARGCRCGTVHVTATIGQPANAKTKQGGLGPHKGITNWLRLELRFPGVTGYVGDEWSLWDRYRLQRNPVHILFSFENGRNSANPGSRIIGDWGDPTGTAAVSRLHTTTRAHGGSFQWNTMRR